MLSIVNVPKKHACQDHEDSLTAFVQLRIYVIAGQIRSHAVSLAMLVGAVNAFLRPGALYNDP